MSPIDPLQEALLANVNKFINERVRNVSEVNLDELQVIYREIENSPYEMEKPYDSYNISRLYLFTRFFVELSNTLNTPTPNWKKVLYILHYIWIRLSDSDEMCAFWGIGNKLGEDIQKEDLKCMNCHMYSDGLIISNQTGISLSRIMHAYSNTIILCDCDSTMNTVLTLKVVSMFINQLYFDDYINRIDLMVGEKNEMPYEHYEDFDYVPEFEFDEDDRVNLSGETDQFTMVNFSDLNLFNTEEISDTEEHSDTEDE